MPATHGQPGKKATAFQKKSIYFNMINRFSTAYAINDSSNGRPVIDDNLLFGRVLVAKIFEKHHWL
jgi:hypothetical protein